MWRTNWWTVSPFVLAGIFSLAAWPAHGDVIPISLIQSVGGMEAPLICVGGDIGTCSSNSSSFSVSNSTPGPYIVSKSDQATASIDTLDLMTNTVTSSAQTDQSSDETANSISVSMSTTTEIEIGGDILAPEDGGFASASNDYSFQFDLSAPSLVHLTGLADAEEYGPGEVLSFTQNVAFSLTGTAFDLDSTSPSSTLYYPCEGTFCGPPFPVGFDDTFSLAPGVYTFTVMADASESAGVALGVTNFEGLSLQLDFTPVPEPRWAAILVSLLLMVGCWTSRRKCRGCDTHNVGAPHPGAQSGS